ncbi:GumC family protein [Mameliella sediminis]|uniref:GumC family protein n=1 Tax=Mameliella sediminis TaxID=2836866 RepID=UPI001C466348|nr:Wzz/FepE/Etk N-terminal domain-containing protein [Mameliella sediminis]MBV7395174.1 chain-length determining protein [Mameliella sediminis]MBY6159630.1 chain-length determining protein [Mameliella alba]MBY6168101.1 chain-length determining protein [Mameliella alba]MBY6173122.1 chain-length determining protein [Mameliella alba]
MTQFQSIGEVFAALRRRALLILVVTFLGCLASLYYAMGQTKIYEATAVVQIEDAQVPDQLAGAAAATSDAARRVRLIEQRLMARDNLVKIMEKHDLFSDVPAMTMNERVGRMRDSIRIQQLVAQTQGFGAGANAPSGLMITVQSDDPQKAADVANDLMQTVIDQSRTRSVRRARDTLEFFAAEEARVGAEIEALEAQIAEFKRANAEQLPSGVADLRSQLASLRDTDLDLDQQILTLQTATDRTRVEVRDRQVAALQEQKALIAARIAQLNVLIEGAPDVEREFNRLDREMTKLREQYEVTTRRKAEAELGQLLEDRKATDRFEALETALVPEYSISRSRKKLAMMGGMVSVMVALALAFAIETLNPAIRSAAQMERVLGVQPVVAIPVVSTRQDRRSGGLRFMAKLLAIFAVFGLGLRLLWDRSPAMAELLGRFLPRTIRG